MRKQLRWLKRCISVLLVIAMFMGTSGVTTWADSLHNDQRKSSVKTETSNTEVADGELENILDDMQTTLDGQKISIGSDNENTDGNIDDIENIDKISTQAGNAIESVTAVSDAEPITGTLSGNSYEFTLNKGDSIVVANNGSNSFYITSTIRNACEYAKSDSGNNYGVMNDSIYIYDNQKIIITCINDSSVTIKIPRQYVMTSAL